MYNSDEGLGKAQLGFAAAEVECGVWNLNSYVRGDGR